MSCFCCRSRSSAGNNKGTPRNSFDQRSPMMDGLAYGAVMFGSSALNNLFVTYHLDFYMTVVRVKPTYFYVGHAVFMVWNACNDVLFGWLSDTVMFRGKGSRRSRLPAIRWGGIFWSLAFLVVWFPYGGSSPLLSGINFALNLCIYDAMLSLVEVNHHAMLAEMVVDSTERARFNSWSGICAAFGSLTSWTGHIIWDKHDLRLWRLYSLAVALLCAASFEFAARQLRYREPKSKTSQLDLAQPCNSNEPFSFLSAQDQKGVEKGAFSSSSQDMIAPMASPFFSFTRNLCRQRNFFIFALVSATQTFDCALGKNFFGLFLELMVGAALPPTVRGLMISGSFLLPWVGTIYLSRGLEKKTNTLVDTLFSIWVVRLVVLAFAAPVVCYGSALTKHHQLLVAFVLLVNRVISECVCRLMPLVESDLIDENKFITRRNDAMSATIVGTANLFSKPSQSLGPMVGFALISQFSINEVAGGEEAVRQRNMGAAFILVGLPFVCVMVQCILWTQWSLRNHYLTQVKRFVQELSEVIGGSAAV